MKDESGDLPPAFPEWLKRMFPTLRAEDTNALFQAFRRRRLLHRGSNSGRRRMERRLRALMSLFAPVAMLLLVSIFDQNLGRVGSALVAVAFLAYLGAMRMGQRRDFDATHFPEYLDEVYGTERFAENAAIDVWLAGTSARDIVEAIYLELYAKVWRGEYVAVMMVLLFFASNTVLRTKATGGILLLQIVLMVLAGFACWWSNLAFQHDYGIELGLRARLLEWDRRIRQGRDVTRKIFKSRETAIQSRVGTITLTMMVLPIPIALLVIGLIGTAVGIAFPGGELKQHWLEVRGVLILPTILLTASGIFQLIFVPNGTRLAGQLSAIAEDAEQPLRDLIEKFAEGGGAK